MSNTRIFTGPWPKNSNVAIDLIWMLDRKNHIVVMLKCLLKARRRNSEDMWIINWHILPKAYVELNIIVKIQYITA